MTQIHDSIPALPEIVAKNHIYKYISIFFVVILIFIYFFSGRGEDGQMMRNFAPSRPLDV